MRLIKLYILLIVVAVSMSCTKTYKSLTSTTTIEKMEVYAAFYKRGYTTVCAFSYFSDLKKDKVKKIRITSDDLRNLAEVMKRAKKIHHFQRKLAGELLFCEIKFSENSKESKILISIDDKNALIMDLTARKDFWIADSLDVKWMLDFSSKWR